MIHDSNAHLQLPEQQMDTSRLPLSLTLNDVLMWRATREGEKPAVIYERAPFASLVLTWRQLYSYSVQMALRLVTYNVTYGSRVALVLQDSPGCLAALFAIWSLGAIAVPIDERAAMGTAETIISHSSPICITGGSKTGIEFSRSLAFIPFDELQEQYTDSPLTHAGDTSDVAMIAYTSGTTSSPKGVILRHRHLRNAYRIARDSLFTSPPNRIGNVFRTAGLGVLGITYLFALECGAAVVVLTALNVEEAHCFWDMVRRNAVDFIYLVPTLVRLIVRMSEPVKDPRGILCITGGAPISEHVHSIFQDRFGHPLRNVYGLTETTCGILWGAYEPNGRGAWHLGRAPRQIRVRLRDREGRCEDAVAEGELEVSGPILSEGYWINPAETDRVFVGGWLHTGDVATRDEHGNYSITGRIKNIVIRGGVNIQLEEIDETFLSHPEVLSACTVGIADLTGEERLAALVQLREMAPTTAEDLAVWCRARIGVFKTPGMIFLTREQLPRNSSGKVISAAVAKAVSDLIKREDV